MISPRPLKYERRLVDRGDRDMYTDGFVDASGTFSDLECLDADDIQNIVACVNAFHEAGIDPADLPKFVEAVRLRAKVASNWGAKAICQTTNIECDKAFRNAAACLPENRKDERG